MRSTSFVGVVVVGILLALGAHEACCASNSTIVFGMSAPRNTATHPAAHLAVQFASGINLAFKEVNEKYGGVNGHQLVLLVQEDNNTLANTMANVANMIDNLSVFAIAGVIGAEQSQGAAYVCAQKNTPLIGPYAGNYNLYAPFNRLFVNVRASYADEVNTMLSFLSTELQLTKVAAFYQNESIALFGFSNLTLAFNLFGLQLVSQGVYDKNAAVSAQTIGPAVQDVYANGTAQPEGIVCFGSFAQIVMFISMWRNLSSTSGCLQCRDTYFVVASVVGPELFSGFLQLQGITPTRPDGALALYVTQVVPFPDPAQAKPKIVAEYISTKDASSESNTTASFTELEGYLVGRVIVDTLFRLRSRDSTTWGTSPNFDTSTAAARAVLRQLFLETIYDVTNTLNIAGLTLGPFSDTMGNRCNQGMRQVYMTALAGNYTYVPVADGDFSFPEVCGSQTSDVARPLIFGQSADFSSSDKAVVAHRVRAGILAAFAGRNARQNGYNGRKLRLISTDDQGNSARAAANVNTLVNENAVFGIMGSVGDSTVTAVTDLVTSLQVPMVGPISGSPDLREPWRENVVNIRASVVDETKLLVNHMVTGLGMVRAMALWSDDATGANGLKALSDSLRVFGANVVANASYNPATGNVAQAFAWLDAASNSLGLAPQAIFLYGTQNPVAQFIVQAHSRWPSAAFFATSSASADGLSQTLGGAGVATNVQLYLSSVTPNPWDTSLPLVAQYLTDMQSFSTAEYIGFASLEGYIGAAFALQVLDLLPATSNPTGQQFLDAIYSRELVAFQGLRLGPFGNTVCTRNTMACKCNQGLHTTWTTKMNATYGWENLPNNTLEWTTCTSTSTCGDGVCHEGSGETAASCPQDCSPCGPYPSASHQAVCVNNIWVVVGDVDLAAGEKLEVGGAALIVTGDLRMQASSSLHVNATSRDSYGSITALGCGAVSGTLELNIYFPIDAPITFTLISASNGPCSSHISTAQTGGEKRGPTLAFREVQINYRRQEAGQCDPESETRSTSTSYAVLVTPSTSCGDDTAALIAGLTAGLVGGAVVVVVLVVVGAVAWTWWVRRRRINVRDSVNFSITDPNDGL